MRAAVLTMRGWTLLLRGKAPQARPVLAEAFRLADGLDKLGPDWPWLHILLRTRIPLGEFEQARAENAELCRRAQEAGALATVSAAGLLVADAAFRLGDWEAADAAALQTFQLAEEVGHRHMAGWALTIRTRILAAQGRSEESRAAAATALAIAESDRISTGLRFVHGALGFLELGLDRIDAAICELETVERLTQGSGHEEPVIVPWVPDLVEAYARQGREGDARRVLARLERQAVCSTSPVAAAAAARCRGLLDDDFDAAFAGALAFDDRRPMPFERARTLLAYGRRLHRACRRAAAREHLRAALEDSNGCTRAPGPARPRPSCARPAGATGRRRTTVRSRRRNGAWPRRCGAERRTVTSRPTCSCRPRRSSSTCARSIASSTFTPGPSSSPRSRRRRTPPPNRPGLASAVRVLPVPGVPEELPHHRAVRLAPGHHLETVPGEGCRDPGEQVAGMRRHGRVDRIGLQGRGARRGRRRQRGLDQGVHDAQAAV